MAKQTGKAGLNDILSQHANDDTTYRQPITNLPGGINGGIAKLVEAKLGTYRDGTPNAGKPFIYLAGAVVKPTHATKVEKVWEGDGVKVVSNEKVDIEGVWTSQTLPLCSTSQANGKVISQDENVKRALNELRTLGGDTSEISSLEDLSELLGALKEEGPYFKFSTTATEPNKQRPTSRVFENWYGSKGLEDFMPEEGEPVDETPEDESEEGEDDDTDNEEIDLEALVLACEEQDEDAQMKLVQLAKECGIEDSVLKDPEVSWQEVAEMIAEANAGEESGEDESEEEEEPEEIPDDEEEEEEEEEEEGEVEPPSVGDIVKVKDGGKTLKVKVTFVNKGSGTFSAKGVANPAKKLKGIAWADILS